MGKIIPELLWGKKKKPEVRGWYVCVRDRDRGTEERISPDFQMPKITLEALF